MSRDFDEVPLARTLIDLKQMTTELLLLHACKPDDQLMAEADGWSWWLKLMAEADGWSWWLKLMAEAEKLKRALQVDVARSCSGVVAADAVCWKAMLLLLLQSGVRCDGTRALDWHVWLMTMPMPRTTLKNLGFC
jgi:hypothetical protein